MDEIATIGKKHFKAFVKELQESETLDDNTVDWVNAKIDIPYINEAIEGVLLEKGVDFLRNMEVE